MSEVSSRVSPVLIRHSIPPNSTEWQEKWLSQLPSLEALTDGLRDVFRDRHGIDQLRVVDREINMHWSRCPTEIVTCASGNGRFRVLCKYEPTLEEEPLQHRGGIEYEAQAYEQVLSATDLTRVRFYGLYVEPASQRKWLVLEYLEGAHRAHYSGDAATPELAARWIAQFHTTMTARSGSYSFMNEYDEAYYRKWPLRTAEFAADLNGRYPWLDDLWLLTDTWVSTLLAAPRTVIHGEFYPQNLLARDDALFPIDWESAAVGPGEIDLASLTDGQWAPEEVERCERAYSSTRWRQHEPDHFRPTLAAARIYLHLRWLGERRKPIRFKRFEWRFEQLRRDFERLRSA